MTHSPAHSVCGSTEGCATKSPATDQLAYLKRDNAKLHKKLTLLREKTQGTEKLLVLHKELKEAYSKLQMEVSSQSDSEMKIKWTEAQERAQRELEKRCEIQKQLSEALERCQREQESTLALLKERAAEQAVIMELKREVQLLKEALSKSKSAAQVVRVQAKAWKDFEKDLQQLLKRTGSHLRLEHLLSLVVIGAAMQFNGPNEEREVQEFGLVEGVGFLAGAEVIKQQRSSSEIRWSRPSASDSSYFPLQNGDTPSPLTGEQKQICGDGLETKRRKIFASTSLPEEKRQKRDIRKSRKSKKMTGRTTVSSKNAQETETVSKREEPSVEAVDRSPMRKPEGQRKVETVDDLIQLLCSCEDQASLTCLVDRTLQNLLERAFTWDQLIHRLHAEIQSCAEDTAVMEGEDTEAFAFLFPWCHPLSQRHRKFCLTVSFILSLDDIPTAETKQDAFLFSFSKQMHDLLLDSISSQESLKASAMAAAIGHVCKAAHLNQFFSEVLMDVLLAEDCCSSIVVLHSLLFSWPSFFEASIQRCQKVSGSNFLIETLFSAIAHTCASCLAPHGPEQLCSKRMAAYGLQHKWWSEILSHTSPIHLRSGLDHKLQ